MSWSIVIKTYENDLEWLQYSLKSIAQYVIPFNEIYEILIYSHDVCCDKVKNISKILVGCNVTIIPVNYNYHGYIKQMIVKAEAYKDVKTEYIVYIDSDCIFTGQYNFSSLLNSNMKPYWYITDDIKNYGIPTWHEAVKNMTCQDMKYYYMYNTFPFVIKTSTLKLAQDKFYEIHGKTYEEFVQSRLNLNIEANIVDNFYSLSRIFTEFEYIGYIAHNFTDDYEFILGTPNKTNITQYWSHGGINDEIRLKLSS